jgi:hypothetical protein
MTESKSKDRTGDVLRDAADDLQEDWPWYAEALRVMRDCLSLMGDVEGETGRLARAALKRAVQAAQGGASPTHDPEALLKTLLVEARRSEDSKEFTQYVLEEIEIYFKGAST